MLVDLLEHPGEVIGNVHCVRTECEDRQDVAFDGVADHQKALGPNAEASQGLGVGVRVLLEQNFDVGKVMFETRCRDLARLMHQVTLGDHHRADSTADGRQHFRHVRQHMDRLGEHVLADFDNLLDHLDRHCAVTRSDRGANHRNGECLDPVARH